MNNMKIAMLYASWEKFGEPWSTPQGIRTELESRGHDVRHYNLYHDDGELPQNGMRRYSNQGINSLLAEMRAGQYEPDAVLVMDYGPWDAAQFDKRFFPDTVLLSEAGDEPQSHRQHFAKAARVHWVLSPDVECVNRYHNAGFNAVHWTHFADTRVFRPLDDVARVFDCVTTCGGRRVTDKIQKKLGHRFNNERYFYGHDHAVRLNMGNIVFQCSQHGEITRRVFEGMACGRMVLTDRLREETGLSDWFVDGEDIVYYDDADDAVEKILYYSEHPEERERIAKNGYNAVMSDHTQVQRCNLIEDLIIKSKKEMML
jgi:hypothetical protein